MSNCNFFFLYYSRIINLYFACPVFKTLKVYRYKNLFNLFNSVVTQINVLLFNNNQPEITLKNQGQ